MSDFDGSKTGLIRQLVADTGDMREEVAEVRTKVGAIESDHRELRDELRQELANVRAVLEHHTTELHRILIWAAAAAVLVPTAIGGTGAAFLFVLSKFSKIPPEAWASLLK